MKSHKFREVTLNASQQKSMDVARVAFIQTAPFFAHLYFSVGREVYTYDLPTAATDGRHIFINPNYFCSLRVGEQVFVLLHEMYHLVGKHPQRFKYYDKVAKNIKGKPVVLAWANVCADYVINADIKDAYGSNVILNKDWLYDKSIKGSELWEDVYERTLKVITPPPGGGGNQPPKGNPGGGSGGNTPTTQTPETVRVGSPMKHARGDEAADKMGGRFDEVLDPPVDPATGEVDLPEEHEFQEAVARAHAAAKAMGKVPASVQRMVDEILAPQVDWRDQIRLVMTGRIGSRGETWDRPNRRRLALNPIVVTPGRKGYGAELVVIGVDTSGSIGPKEEAAFFAEIGGILADIRPRRIVIICCDAKVQQVDEVANLDEFEGVRVRGTKGGGGTDFRPVFDYVAEHNLKPETLVYLTDMYGAFPDDAPAYPVIWAATTDKEAPWGDVVRIKVE